MLALALMLAAETAKLPPANPLPPPDGTVAGIMAPVDALFAALAKRDGSAILVQTRPEGGAAVATENPNGTRSIRHMSWEEFAAGIKPGPERYEEKLTDPAIEIDGDIAMIWSPYVFLIDGKVHHCGYDHFDLLREAGRWKILNITWSSRRTGCEELRPQS